MALLRHGMFGDEGARRIFPGVDEGGRRRGRDGEFVESVGGGEGVLKIKGRREGCGLGRGDAEFGGVGIISLREVKVNLTRKPRLICPINSGG